MIGRSCHFRFTSSISALVVWARSRAEFDFKRIDLFAMIDVKDKPQILQHLEKSLNVTIYETRSRVPHLPVERFTAC